MAAKVVVESLSKGSAEHQIPDRPMTGKHSKVATAIGTVVTHHNGKVWHKFNRMPHWELAVYHYSIRHQLIDYANTQGRFDHEPAARRDDDLDVTSYHPEQQTWGPERNQFPPVLFEYAPPGRKKRVGESKYMYFNGTLVLDKEHRPVKAWPQLNLTLSTKVEGFRLEAIQRLNQHIATRDLLARMVPEVITQRTRGKQRVVKTEMKANALSMRKREFRGRNGMLSWTTREGTKEIKEYLDSRMGPERVARNNTRDMPPPTPQEFERIMFLIGKGKHPERSRKNKGVTNSRLKGGEVEPTGDEVDSMMNAEAEQSHDDSDDDKSTNVEDHFEPLTADEMDCEGTTVFSDHSTLEADLNDRLDCRSHVPSNEEEMEIVRTAISESIEQYNELLNTHLTIDAPSFFWESYNTQWLALQEALENGWTDQGWLFDDCPTLHRVGYYAGDLKDWLLQG